MVLHINSNTRQHIFFNSDENDASLRDASRQIKNSVNQTISSLRPIVHAGRDRPASL